LQNEVSIFGVIENTAISSRKWHHMALCFVNGGDASIAGVMCKLEERVTPTSDKTVVSKFAI